MSAVCPDRRNRGFTLIELMIVLAIILILAAISITNLVRSRIAASEASAVNTLVVIFRTESVYYSSYGSYSPDLASLGKPASGPPTASAADLADDLLSGKVSGNPVQFNKNGYVFAYTAAVSGTQVTGFTVRGDPQTRGATGTRSFYIDQRGVVHVNTSAPASATDPVLN